jgi:altronate dehydratase
MLRLDHVVDYGEPLPGNGFAFMDSPGNDLESVAGQVASGCNLVFFTTGNGSITNFPFVPTLKFVTTTDRYDLLQHEMDVDAGRYLTGTPMDRLTDEVLDLTIRTASGRRTAGERAGHSQVSIWREWRQTTAREGISVALNGGTARPLGELPEEDRDALLDGRPVPVAAGATAPPAPDLSFTALRADDRSGPEHVALVLPTSLCSGQIALRLAGQAEADGWLGDTVSRVVALPHTEGCGVTSGAAEETFVRTMLGHLLHPSVRLALLLEHGCEKTHNDYFRHRLVDAGGDPDRYGWASIQADGGIAATSDRVRNWFTRTAAPLDAPAPVPGQLGDLTIGLEARGAVTPATAETLATVGSWLVASGGTVLLSSRSALLAEPAFGRTAFGTEDPAPTTLAHGQRPAQPGWHVMRMPGNDWLETATGMGACGAHLLLAHAAGGSLTASRMTPLVQVSSDPDTVQRYGSDLDAALDGPPAQAAAAAVEVLRAVASRTVQPRAQSHGDVGFQVTRGLLGVSM